MSRLAGGEPVVQGHCDRTQQLYGEICAHRYFRGLQIQGHPIAAANPEIEQRLRAALHALVPGTVAPAALFKYQRRVIRIALDTVLEQEPYVHGACC